MAGESGYRWRREHRKGSRYRDLLRARLADNVAVSAGKMHLFLYAGSAKAADEAGQALARGDLA
jgi:hypothetical protein